MPGIRPVLKQPETAQDLDTVRMLFEQYAAALDFALDFQNFGDELQRLPGDYAPPTGRLIVAMSGAEPVGCVALRRIAHDMCEMKRLYTVPSRRNIGVGRLLVEAIIDAARQIGYKTMRLDTVRSMKTARHLYASIGFTEIEPYRFNPIDGATYLELELTPRANRESRGQRDGLSEQ